MVGKVYFVGSAMFPLHVSVCLVVLTRSSFQVCFWWIGFAWSGLLGEFCRSCIKSTRGHEIIGKFG